MNQDIKLIVTDLDGTFLDSYKNIPQINIDAVKACKEAGIHVCPCSARNWSSLKDIAEEAGMDGYIMGCNGVLIMDAKPEEIHYRNKLDPEAVGPLIRIAMKYGTRISVMANDHMISMKSMRREFASHRGDIRVRRGPHKMVEVDTLEEFIEAAKDECNVLFVWMDHDDHLPMYTEMCDVGDFELSAADEDHVYVMAKDSTKGNACDIVAKLYGIGPENVMCFGDGKNDIPMLRYASIGVAMENAMEQTKDSADYIAPSNDEGGFGKTVFKLIFGEDR